MANTIMQALKHATCVGSAVIGNTVSQHRLQQSLENFHRILTPEESSKLLNEPPNVQSFLDFASGIDDKGKNRTLRRWADHFGPLLASFQLYSGAVETYFSTHPLIAAWVWGSVKIVIIGALNFPRLFEKLAKMFQALGRLSPILKEFQELFPKSLLDLLLGFYAIVVEFCTEALQFLNKTSILRFGESLPQPFTIDFRKFEAQLQEQKNMIILQQSLASERAAHEIRLEMSLYREESSRYHEESSRHRSAQMSPIYEKGSRYHEEGSRHRSAQIKQWTDKFERGIQKKMNAKKHLREALLNKLSDYNYKTAFLKAFDERHKGTGLWLFDSPEFQQFSQDGSCGLWLHGIPGSGKTILAAGIVDYFFSLRRATRTSISYFFCDVNDRVSLDARTILRSLIRQILNIFDEPSKVSETLRVMLTANHREPGIKELSKLLVSITQLPTTAYLLIDGLDECEDTDRHHVLFFLTNLIKNNQCNVKIVISSRWDLDISKSLEGYQRISLESSRTSSDIDLFIREVIDQNLADGTILVREPSMAEEIKKALVQKADGMFLWVIFQIHDIRRANNDEGICKELQSLPRGLDETYARILDRIQRYHKPDVAKRIFQWLAVTRRPISLDELAEAIAVEPGSLLWSEVEHNLPANNQKLLQNCGNLVTCQKDNIVRFAHSTVLQFLLSLPSSIEVPEADLYVGKVCLTYLSSTDFETQISSIPKASRDISALDMPVSEWVGRSRGKELILNFPRQRLSSVPYSSSGVTAGRFLSQLEPSRSVSSPSGILNKKFTLLEYVAKNWIYHCRNLCQDDQTYWKFFENQIFGRALPFSHLPWEPPSYGSIPYTQYFKWAIENGHTSFFRLLVARLEAKSVPVRPYIDARKNPTLLELASMGGHEALVGIMVGLGVNVNADPGYEGRAALQAAAGGGHLAVVDRLLASGANVNAEPARNRGLTALQAAAEGGHLAVVDRLLASGANVNAEPSYGGRTALQAAAEGGHLAVVECLLASRANVNAKPSYGGRTALQAAAEGGHLAVVECLLASGANVNAEPARNRGLTALQAAAEGGHLAVVDRLLASGANVNAEPARNRGLTALQAAAEGGHLAVVDRLLASGANVNAEPSYEGRTALQAATEGGHLAAVPFANVPLSQDQLKCLQTLYVVDYHSQRMRVPRAIPGTCTWFLRHERYMTWSTEQKSSLLWLSGEPGCGKSVLSSFLVDKLQGAESQAVLPGTVCFFFFKDDHEESSATLALCSLLHQLFTAKSSLIAGGYAMAEFESLGPKLTAELYTLWKLFTKATTNPNSGNVICVIDGLDECGKSTRSMLMKSLVNFYSNVGNPDTETNYLKVIVTSRPYRSIEDGFHDLPRIRLRAENETTAVRRAIELVVDEEIEREISDICIPPHQTEQPPSTQDPTASPVPAMDKNHSRPARFPNVNTKWSIVVAIGSSIKNLILALVVNNVPKFVTGITVKKLYSYGLRVIAELKMVLIVLGTDSTLGRRESNSGPSCAAVRLDDAVWAVKYMISRLEFDFTWALVPPPIDKAYPIRVHLNCACGSIVVNDFSLPRGSPGVGYSMGRTGWVPVRSGSESDLVSVPILRRIWGWGCNNLRIILVAASRVNTQLFGDISEPSIAVPSSTSTHQTRLAMGPLVVNMPPGSRERPHRATLSNPPRIPSNSLSSPQAVYSPQSPPQSGQTSGTSDPHDSHIQSHSLFPLQAADDPRNIQNTAQTSPSSDQFVLFCFNGGDWINLVHFEVTATMRDKTFYKKVRKTYYTHRGWWKQWFSLNVLLRVHFVKFELIDQEFVGICNPSEVPKLGDDNYQFAPNPPDQIPPIQSFMYFFHHNNCARPDNRDLTAIPKRTRGRLAHAPTGFTHGWGIHFIEEPSWFRVWTWTAIVAILTLILAVTYSSVRHDIQGGYGVAAFFVALAAFVAPIWGMHVQTIMNARRS